MARTQQLTFQAKEFEKPKDWFGGNYLGKNHAKCKRPLDSKFPIHLVLRAKDAKIDYSMRHPRHFLNVNRRVRATATKYGIKIYEYSNVGNHLHILLKVKNRGLWARFIRDLTGGIVSDMFALKGRQKPGWRFWSQKPFTRIVRGWGRAYRIMKDYLTLNQLEGEGLISRIERVPRSSSA